MNNAITIKLDIISDVVCPWCIIGYRRIEQALKEMGLENSVEIKWHPFELNPDMVPEGEDLIHHIARKYGMTLPDSANALSSMAANGAASGFTFDFFDTMRMVNTRDAHILLLYAGEEGKQTEMKLRLFEAFFTEQKDVSNRNQLLKEVEAVGLSSDEALTILDDESAQQQLEKEEAHWRNAGVNAVPTMVFNDSVTVTGAQQVDEYKELLKNLIDRQMNAT
jgi:predicted DsbA family dithiol-disulfide isomerase